MVKCLPISKQKYCKLIKHMLSTFQAENRGLHKYAQPELKKGVLIKKKSVSATESSSPHDLIKSIPSEK